MKPFILFLTFLMLQDGQIILPNLKRQQPPPPPVQPDVQRDDELEVDTIYMIESDVPLHVIPSPTGLVTVEHENADCVIRGKFADGNGRTERRKVSKPHAYLVTATEPGSVELIVLPMSATDETTIQRITLTVSSRGPPEPVKPTDEVSAAFDTYEAAWRQAQGVLASRLQSGAITNESDAAAWFGEANTEARRLAFTPLLEAEASLIGGAKWTPQAHAAIARRYADGTAE